MHPGDVRDLLAAYVVKVHALDRETTPAISAGNILCGIQEVSKVTSTRCELIQHRGTIAVVMTASRLSS